MTSNIVAENAIRVDIFRLMSRSIKYSREGRSEMPLLIRENSKIVGIAVAVLNSTTICRIMEILVM